MLCQASIDKRVHIVIQCIHMINNKILNARVSKKLYEKISVEAKKNRITVSNLIRNLVEDALEIHDDIHEAVDKKIRKYLSETEKQNILGYQEIVLVKNTVCDNCDQPLKASTTAYLVFLENKDTRVVFCANCQNKTSQFKKS